MGDRLKRIVVLIDMDCFYVQVEERDNPHIIGIPAAVVQYNGFKGGAIIALNYEARALGIPKDGLRGQDILKICPDIALVRVPELRGKADLTKYRNAGAEVINVISEYSNCVERASIDEAYIDLTQIIEDRLNTSCDISNPKDILDTINPEFLVNNFVQGYESTEAWLQMIKESELIQIEQIRLALGAEISGQIRKAIYEKTGFRCSAGIGHNKVLAKLVCGANKPNKQTVIPHESVQEMYQTTKLRKVRNLGGKLGKYLIEKYDCENMSDLNKFTESDLSKKFGSKTARWLTDLSKGYDDEPVIIRHLPKSIGCSKNFLGPEALRTKEKAKHWITQLCTEVVERVSRDLEENKRRAKLLTLHVTFEDKSPVSRSCGIPPYNVEKMTKEVYSQLEKFYSTFGSVIPINSMGLGASKFEDELDSNIRKIDNFFEVLPHPKAQAQIPHSSTSTSSKESAQNIVTDNEIPSTSKGLATTATANEHLSHIVTSTSTNINSVNSTPQKIDPKMITTKDGKTRAPLFVFTLEPSPKKKFNLQGIGSASNSPIKIIPPIAIALVANSSSTSTSKPSTSTSSTNSHSNQVDFPIIRTEVCERCNKSISIYELAEHMDYHFARDLSRELNGLPSTSNNSSNAVSSNTKSLNINNKRPNASKASGSSTGKRGRKAKDKSNTTTAVSKSQVPMRKIDSYFNKDS